MFDYRGLQDGLFIALYCMAGLFALLAAGYLLLRRKNMFMREYEIDSPTTTESQTTNDSRTNAGGGRTMTVLANVSVHIPAQRTVSGIIRTSSATVTATSFSSTWTSVTISHGLMVFRRRVTLRIPLIRQS